jgi:hypothetical protein
MTMQFLIETVRPATPALYAKYGTLVGAYTGLALFLVLVSVQGVG